MFVCLFEPNVCLFVNWFKKIYWRFLSNGFKNVIGTLAKNLTYAMNLKASFNVHQTKKAFGKGTFACGFKRHKERSQDLRPALNGNVGSEKLMHALLRS